MDWNKTKTIFIIVFSILNVFLYLLYLNIHNESQDIEPLSESSPSERLQADNIKYDNLAKTVEPESYIAGNVRIYSSESMEPRENQTFEILDGGSKLLATFKEPVTIPNVKDAASFEDFAVKNVDNGSFYKLWKIDKEAHKALLFQTVENRFIFYNSGATLTVYWNEENEIIRYEQTQFEELEDFPETVELLPEEEAVSALYNRHVLKPNSTIINLVLGFSTLVQFTESQVFAP
ncbi:MAG: two-component system regulatory protein YycI, partial [Paenisporosarcina sp.]|nr:two-component system regulatory protein YycI [Paenisporosarcina sp.]